MKEIYIYYILGVHYIRVTTTKRLYPSPDRIEEYDRKTGHFSRAGHWMRQINDSLEIEKVTEEEFYRPEIQ